VSVAGLASLGIQLLQGLNQYAGSALDSKGRIKAISTDIDLTVQVVQTLDTTIQDDTNRAIIKDDAVRLIQDTIAQCREIFTKIQSTLPEYSATGRRKRDVITWPFIEPKLDLLRGNLEKLKTSLQLLMNVIILAAMSKRQVEQASLDQQRQQIEKLLEEKAAAEVRLQVLERDHAQFLAVGPSALSISDSTPPRPGQPAPGISLFMVEQSSDSGHTDQGQPSEADRKQSHAETDAQNDLLMTDLYCDYTACLQQTKMLQTSLEAALNEMFDLATGFPTVNSGLASHHRRFLARTVDESARETLECLDQRILRQSSNSEVIKQYNAVQLDQPSNNDVFLSPEYHQNWLQPTSQNARVEAQHFNGDDSILVTDDWAIIPSPGQPLSSTSQRDRKHSLLQGPSEVFSCDICSCHFLRWEHLKRHHDSHYTHSKPSEYVNYEKKFSRTGDLMQHPRTYSDSVVLSDRPQHDLQKLEVGPRDGLQNIKDVVPTATKIELINRLAQTGLQTIEATSFVSARWVPQLSDAKTVMESMKLSVAKGDISFPVLVPNMKGLEAALALDVKEIGIFLSASEGFIRNNINCSVEESLVRAQSVVERARGKNVRVRGYLSCVVDCPYDGKTSPLVVLKMAKKMLEMGCFEISLGDTTGTATPQDIRRLLEVLLREIPADKLAGHFHDSFGQAIANVKEAYRLGIRAFDSSVGGLGGCPYSPGAKGNVATEDLVFCFESMGINTGVDLAKLANIGDWICQQLRVPNSSQIGSALVASSKWAEEAKDTPKQTSAVSSEWRHLSHLIY
ncbi:aldolase, partial [Aureobasidium melanogenum]